MNPYELMYYAQNGLSNLGNLVGYTLNGLGSLAYFAQNSMGTLAYLAQSGIVALNYLGRNVFSRFTHEEFILLAVLILLCAEGKCDNYTKLIILYLLILDMKLDPVQVRQ